MTLLEPPIDKMITKCGSKYGLCVVLSKRAKELLTQNPEKFDDPKNDKPLRIASIEFMEDKFEICD
ncbi:MAG: DNA-directed RNA polymerase subunit omega [Clostridia bacterium]